MIEVNTLGAVLFGKILRIHIQDGGSCIESVPRRFDADSDDDCLRGAYNSDRIRDFL
jgi:hypothetical protein